MGPVENSSPHSISSNKLDNPTPTAGSNGKSDAAIWELDADGGKLNVWLKNQLSKAVEVLNTSTTAKGGNNIIPDTSIDLLYENILKSLQSLKVVDAPIDQTEDYDNNSNKDEEEDDASDDGRGGRYNRQPPRKKRRNDMSQKQQQPKQRLLQDPYKIWFQISTDDDNSNAKICGLIVWNENQDDIPETAGGKLSVLSMGGLLNAMAAVPATMHHENPYLELTSPGLCHTTLPNAKALSKVVAANPHLTAAMKALGSDLSVGQLHSIALQLHRSVSDQLKHDILLITPSRIQQMLASDLTPTEFASIRKRVYDTVILGKGTGNATNEDDDARDIPTAAASAQGIHDAEKFKKCMTCGNNDQSDFILDRKNGDVICANCGTVVAESLMHEGSQFRKFEGEVDRNHHGDASNPLYSNAHNMSTSLSGVQPTTGAGIGGWGSGGASGGKRNLETILKNAHAYTELNVSQFGKTDRRTRVGYKDRQKKDAFIQMTHTGDALNLHEAVLQRAKELFAGFRDDRELVQQFKGVLAACLCEAFEQLSAEGKNLLKQQAAQQQQQEGTSNKKKNPDTEVDEDDDDKDAEIKQGNLSGRAARRNELHHANMAGKGGLLLNNSNENNPESHSAAVDDDNENEKLAASWDLEDCRTWLLEASRRIAQTWVDERNKDTATAKRFPSAPKEELEGQLVEHSITLCEHLEAEWRSRSSSNKATSNGKRVVTPRVTDISKLGIKWQHAHERGSGGKGGVGNNARAAPPVGSAAGGGGRTAGQILILKTAKTLGVVLNDPMAGEAFHKELRSVIDRQEERKRKALRVEATQQRFNQMQRKPWLQARVQQQL